MRFPGFEGEWEEKKLGEIGEFLGGGTPSSSNADYWNGNIPWISSSDLKENDVNEISISRYISDEAVKNSATKLCNAPTIHIVSRVGVGKVAYSTSSLCTSQDFVSIVNFKCNGLFLSYLLSIEMLRAALHTQGTSIKGISSSEIKAKRILVPQIQEQNKISELLSKIDSRIYTQNKIIKELKVQMLGLQEKIFRRKIKIKDEQGNEFPEWELKTIKELFTFKITNSFSREQLNYKNGIVKNIHYGDIHTKFHTLFDIQKEEVPYINTEVNIDGINEENYCAIGDMIFADASEDLIDVGKSIEIVNLNNQKLLSGLHTILARPIGRTFSVGFCGYLFKSNGVKSQIQKESQGSKVLSISVVRLSKVSLSIPCIDEQAKIVDLLSSIDTKIDVESQLLKKLEVQKKFLLQKMFV